MKKITVYSALFILLFSAGITSAADDKNEPSKESSSVVITKEKKMTFEERIETSRNIGTRNYPIVSARSTGIIADIF